MLSLVLEAGYATAYRAVGPSANLVLKRVLDLRCFEPVSIGRVVEIRGREVHRARAQVVVGLTGTPLPGRPGPWMDGLMQFVQVDESGRPEPLAVEPEPDARSTFRRPGPRSGSGPSAPGDPVVSPGQPASWRPGSAANSARLSARGGWNSGSRPASKTISSPSRNGCQPVGLSGQVATTNPWLSAGPPMSTDRSSSPKWRGWPSRTRTLRKFRPFQPLTSW